MIDRPFDQISSVDFDALITTGRTRDAAFFQPSGTGRFFLRTGKRSGLKLSTPPITDLISDISGTQHDKI